MDPVSTNIWHAPHLSSSKILKAVKFICIYKTVYKYIFYVSITSQSCTAVSLLMDPSKHIFSQACLKIYIRLVVGFKRVWQWQHLVINGLNNILCYGCWIYLFYLFQEFFRSFWKYLLGLLEAFSQRYPYLS